MNKYILNPESPLQRVVEAAYFHLQNDYFWFFSDEDVVVSINKAEHINRIDLAA